jgi:nucleotide-binding universal stress UspA family protein
MNTIRRLLFLTDLSPASDRAFEHARLIAERFGASVLAYHAMEVPSTAYVDWGGRPEQAKRDRRADEIRAELRRRCATTAPLDVVVQRDIVSHALVSVIREHLADWRPDLTVLATHARTALTEAFVGSAASQLLHEGVRPLLCVPPAAPPARPYARLLVPTDLSIPSRRALPWAALIAGAFDGEVVPLYVEPLPVLAVLGGLAVPVPPPAADEVRRFALPELEGMRLRPHVAGPAPAWSAITSLARERQADLIVMSSAGHDSLGDHLLGSTTDRVIRHASAPVLVT